MMMTVLVLYESTLIMLFMMDVNGLTPFTADYGVNSARNSSIVQSSKTSSTNHDDDEQFCRDRSDGYSAPVPGSKCRRYYRCGQKAASIYLCPGKNVFDGHRCVPPTDGVYFVCTQETVLNSENTTLESSDLENRQVKDCEGQADGYYQDWDSGCRSYFYCSNGLKAVYVCPTGKVFDGKQCVGESDYQCPLKNLHRDEKSICKETANEESYQADLSSGCRNYHFCSKDGIKLITLTCSDAKVFDGKKCVDPARYHCPKAEDGVAKSDELEAYYAYTHLNREIESQEPAQKTYFIGSSGNNYYDMKNPQQQTTSTSSSDDCERNNGFFVIPGTGCRRYYFCIGGSRTEMDCSGDSIFNGDLCVNPDRFICPEINNNPLERLVMDRNPMNSSSLQDSCSGTTSSGLYLNKKSLNCRGYVYCRMGSVFGPGDECSPSQRFSSAHNRCLPKHQVPCPNTS